MFFPSKRIDFEAFAPPPGLEFLPPGLFEEQPASLGQLGKNKRLMAYGQNKFQYNYTYTYNII
jgi:hypothetical protein